MRPYTDLAALTAYLLEESWVLDVEARPGTLVLRLELVLLPEHPGYTPPPPTEAYCYRSGVIRFEGVERLSWIQGELMYRSTDLDGSTDYGNIDSFEWALNEFHLEGSFGRIEVQAQNVTVELRG